MNAVDGIARLRARPEHGLQPEVIEAVYGQHDAVKGHRYGRVGGIGVVRFAAHLIAMNLDAESAADWAGGAAQGNRIARARDRLNGKTILAQPGNHFVYVSLTYSEAVRILFRSEPGMVVWRRGILLLRQQLDEIGLLAGRGLKHHNDIRKLHGRVYGALIHAGFRPRTHMAGQSHALAIVDGHSDPVRGPQRMRERETQEQNTSGNTSTLRAARGHAK